MRPADTDSEAGRVQLDLFRHATPAQRASLARSSGRTMLRLAQRAIREAYPTADGNKLAVRFVA